MEKNEQTKQTESEGLSFDLYNLFQIIYKNIWRICIVALLCGLLSLGYSILAITPLYRASALFYVNNYVALGDTSLSISSNDISTSKNLVDSYMVILKTKDTLTDVIDYADLSRSAGELSGMISASDVNGTEIFRVTVTSEDPQEAEKIANALAHVVPKRISSIIEGSSAKVVDYAVTPGSPFTPNYRKNFLTGVIFGLFLSLGFIVLIELFDITIKREDDVKNNCRYPILSMIPNMHKNGDNGYYYRRYYYQKQPKNNTANTAENDGTTPETSVIGKNISFTANEAYKLLRTKLQYSFADDKQCHVFAVSSALAGEGKSITSINLAYSLAQLNKRVLLIDCDMRRPTMAKRLSLNSFPGLSEYLTGFMDFKDLFQTFHDDPEQQPVTVITAGNTPPNPIELLNSEKMNRAMNSLREQFDYIVLDMPPVCEVADALVSPSLVDGLLLVVRLKYCNRLALREAIQQFEFVNTRILGVVLNFNSDKQGVYRKYRYKYPYAYRYGLRYGYRYGKRYGYHSYNRYGYHDSYRYGYNQSNAPEQTASTTKADIKRKR